MSRNVDPYIERRVVGALAYRTGEIEDYPDLASLLEDPLAKSAWGAVQKVKSPSADALALLMSRNGYPKATPEIVARDILGVVGDRPEEVPLDFYVKMLEGMTAARRIAPKLNLMASMVEAGKMTPQEVAEKVEDEVAALGVLGAEFPMISTDEWGGEFVEQIQAENARAARDNQIALLPPDMWLLRKSIGSLLGRLTCLLADTGAGKTILASQVIPHHMAREHGRTVMVFSTEMSREELMHRYIIERCAEMWPDQPPPTIQQLEGGYMDDRIREVLKPYRTGRVIIVEAAGMPISTILALARRKRADIVVDLASGIGVPGKYHDRDDVWLNRMLEMFSAYAKKHRRAVICTMQSTASARRDSRKGVSKLSAEDTSGGAAWEDKADIFLVLQSKMIKTENGTGLNIRDPFTGKILNFPEGSRSPVGVLAIKKSRKCGLVQQLVWRTQWFSIRGIPEDQVAHYREMA